MTSSRTNARDHLFKESLEKFLVSTTDKTKTESWNLAKDCHASTPSGWGMYWFFAHQVYVTFHGRFMLLLVYGKWDTNFDVWRNSLVTPLKSRF